MAGVGTPFTGPNCSAGTQTINVTDVPGSCSGGGAGLLMAAYQDLGNPQNPVPFNPTDVCQNLVSPLAFQIDNMTFNAEPGYYQILNQTNFIGQTCSGGVDFTITIN